LIDQRTKRDIEKLVERLLKDIDALEPPLRLQDVLDHLKLFTRYYNLDDPNLIRETEHKIRISAQIGLKKIKKIFRKISLKAMTFPEEGKILIDNSIPNIKQRWAESHEICHNLIPTHKYFLIGDVSETLDPEYQEMLEAEANYGSSALIFMGKAFSKEALDMADEWKTIMYFKKKYGNTIASTLRRYVQFSNDTPKIGFIHTPRWMPKPDDQIDRCRHFIKSKKFDKKFSKVSSKIILDNVEAYISQRRGGPVGEGEFVLSDDNGDLHKFVGSSFFNRYYVMTLITNIN
jgi:hypothetical protein